MHILLVEDDLAAADDLVQGLRQRGHVADHASDGESGLQQALGNVHEALIVDRMLPKLDGLELVRILRSRGCETPVLLLSALGEVDDRVKGLQAGGDDYLVKPYAFSELLARLDALTRRYRGGEPARLLSVADLEVDLITHRVTRSSTLIRLQPREQRLLEYLMRHAGQIVTRSMLLEQVWDLHFDPQTNIIDTQISRLRAKIDRDFSPSLLHTLRGIGYKLDETP